MTERMYQCQMRMVRCPAFHTTGWIPAKAAKVGLKVEILPQGEWWEVVQVYTSTSMLPDYLKRHQLSNRRSLPSIEAIS